MSEDMPVRLIHMSITSCPIGVTCSRQQHHFTLSAAAGVPGMLCIVSMRQLLVLIETAALNASASLLHFKQLYSKVVEVRAVPRQQVTDATATVAWQQAAHLAGCQCVCQAADHLQHTTGPHQQVRDAKREAMLYVQLPIHQEAHTAAATAQQTRRTPRNMDSRAQAR
jgi:hypothetical protein